LNESRGITNEVVDAYDLLEEEPGDGPDSPYRDTHCFAMGRVRRIFRGFGMSVPPFPDDTVGLCKLPAAVMTNPSDDTDASSSTDESDDD
jgi:hypothetical protein